MHPFCSVWVGSPLPSTYNDSNQENELPRRTHKASTLLAMAATYITFFLSRRARIPPRDTLSLPQAKSRRYLH